MRIADPEYNRLQLLKAIRRSEPVSRSQLIDLTGLAWGTITELTRDLVARNFLLEEKVRGGGRGRPSVKLRLNPGAVHVVGALLEGDGTILVEVVDTCGESVFSHREPIGRPRSVEEVATAFSETIAQTVALSELSLADVQYVGVTLPAIADSVRGLVHWLGDYSDPPVPVARIIRECLGGIPVVLDSTSNVMARGEHWFGEGEGLDDFSLFNFGTGISHARYVDGALLTGANGMNSEFAHTKIVLDEGRLCYCGNRGCLAAHCTVPAVIAQLHAERGEPAPEYRNIMDSLAALAADAATEAQLRSAFAGAARLLGIAVANHVNQSDPARVIVQFGHGDLRALMEAPFLAAVNANCLPPFRDRAMIEVRIVPPDLHRKGAAALGLEKIYRDLVQLDRLPDDPAGR